MIHLEVVGSSASPRANLLDRLGLLDDREGARVGSPSAVYPSPHPTPRDARIIRIPSPRKQKGHRTPVSVSVTDLRLWRSATVPPATVDYSAPSSLSPAPGWSSTNSGDRYQCTLQSATSLPNLGSSGSGSGSGNGGWAERRSSRRARHVTPSPLICVGAKIHQRRAAQRSSSQQQQQPQLHHYNAPLPEDVDEDLPTDYLATVNRAIVSYNSTPSSSGRSSPTNAEVHSTLTISQGGWTTGNTTERSSVDSSCYSLDEFDRQAASTVNQHFEEFESMLFEGPRETGSSVHRECQEWVTQFPHLRVLGKQLMSPSDSGYLFIATDSSSDTTPRPSTSGIFDLSLAEHDLSAGSDTQGLTLSGRKVKASRPPPEVSNLVSARSKLLDTNYSSSDFGFLHEETFAQDGVYEDIIAVDYKNIYEDNMEHKKQITPRRRRVGYPPITPNACVKDSVSSGAFDKMWCEIMSWLRLLLRRYGLELEAKKNAGSLEHGLEPTRPVRTSSFFFTPQNMQMLPDRTLPALYVSRMELRDRNSQGMTSAEMTDSAVLGESSHAAQVPVQRTANSRPSTMHHPRRRPNHSQHLDPLREPSKVFSSEEGRNLQSIPQNALSVKQIGPPGPHHLSSPPMQMHGRLPPLESSSSGPSHRKFGHRASSAIDNKEGRKHGGRERNNSTCEASRPSTTIAIRSDTPFGGMHNLRSSTPMVQSIPGRQLYVMGNSGGLNVMGNGLNPSAEPAPNILQDHEGSPMDRHNQWIPNTPSFSFFKQRRTLRN